MLVSSRRFHQACTHKIGIAVSGTTVIPSTYPIRAGESIYIHTTALRNFCMSLLPRIQVPFLLVTGDSTWSVPDDCREETKLILANAFLIKWYAQNCTTTEHEKLIQIPLGLDFHTPTPPRFKWNRTPNSSESDVFRLRDIPRTQQIKCYGNFHFLMTTRFGQDRRDAFAKVPKHLVFYEPHRVPRIETWTNMVKYKYVLSPHGEGLDCHRTWEAIAMGCIPIVKTSPLDPLFEGLPVLIVQEWSDITQELLKSFVPDRSRMEKITHKYWWDLINR